MIQRKVSPVTAKAMEGCGLINQGQNYQFKWSYGDLKMVTRLIASSKDVNSAFEIIARHLKELELSLMSVVFCDLEGENPSIRPYRDMPGVLGSLANEFYKIGGCPIIKEARRLQQPFDALSINKKDYPSFLEKRFFNELTKLGHRRILVIPIALGRGLCNLVIGTGNRTFTPEFQTELFNSVGQTFAATLGKFPEVAKLFETKVLSTYQAEILFLVSIGTDIKEIGRVMSLGTNTIDQLAKDAQKKLGANNLPHAIAKAIAFGEISNANIGQAEQL
ncbi:MAG: helix-turn-helix transcriptional regulator [Rhizobiaceae bacterium]